jgi:prevent-host-death family protein
MPTLSVSEARNEFAELVNRAGYGGERILVARRGRPLAGIVSAEDVVLLQALEDALDLAAVRSALRDPESAHPLDWSAVRERLGS